MRRVVDYWAAWYAALFVLVTVFLLGIMPYLIVGLLMPDVMPYVAPVGGLADVGLAAYAFRIVAKGLVYDPASHAVDMPAILPIDPWRQFLPLGAYGQFFRRERVAVAEIRMLAEQEVTNTYSRGPYAGTTSYFLNVSGEFGTRAIHFRSRARRAEARAFLEALVKAPPRGQSPISGAAGVSPIS